VTHRSPLKNPPTWIDVEGRMPWRFPVEGTVPRWRDSGWTCSGALCSQADGFTELDISARRGSISAPDDRRDRKGKRVKNGWPRCVT
jgi:hypothetical protein